MTQLALMDTQQFVVHKPKAVSRLDDAIAAGLSLMDFMAKESRLNDRFYGINYKQRSELSLIGLTFEWIRTDRFKSGELPERPAGLSQVYADFAQRDEPQRAPKKEKPYQPQSLERKQRTRCGRLFARAVKRFSLLELRQEWLYQQVEKNPDYFGICVIHREV
jgi:hypothetical protein